MESVRGLFYEEGSSRAIPAVLRVMDGAVVIEGTDSGDLIASDRKGRARVTARLGDIPRQVSLRDLGTFETDDNDGIDRLLTGPIDKLLPWLERGRWRIAAAVVITIAGMFSILRFGVPAATRAAVDATPPSVETDIASGILASLDATVFEPSQADEARRAALQERFAELVALHEASETSREGANYVLKFRASEFIGANAMAFPGGLIIVTDDLLDLIADDDLVTAILAHEISHVEERHSLYRLYRSASVGGLILFLGGDLGTLAEDAVVQGAALSNLAYSRDMESEADEGAVALLLEAGVDPMGLVEALELLTEDCESCGETSWLSTHPGIDERRARIEELARRP